ncbi:hypothetical protein DGG96_01145 [Legionella qingyii]|uniref:Uncharacterized protein n=1 Tax=Legionella qingyii TaxID=2184757 RepID=A0A317U7Q0_9GAMM|nr:hypothetical protein [Legionella qingyii]PWY57024.1 hypothetical protein DGG96_03280 [Legionella qingyii]PWY57355.1 hypothetical protein DGG96_01145 [Legionella qingyii]RUR26444.1 hypothetical protein ELY20_00550 [Legionella qingyii]RUR27464.1 hypothetical protein ELY16_04895 [Legionella qingyii]
MKTVIKSIYLVAALSLPTLTAYADDSSTSAAGTSTSPASNSSDTSTSKASTSSFIGDYQCQRVDSANNTVAYPLTVSKTGDTYTLEWDNSNGEPVLYGTGVMHPNQTNVVASSFWDPRKPEVIGIQMIEIKPDGSLQSNWVLQSDNQLGSETCTKSK